MEPVRLQLEIEPGSDPISGSIAEPGAAARAFQGWLELNEAIERARAGLAWAAGAAEAREPVPAEEE